MRVTPGRLSCKLYNAERSVRVVSGRTRRENLRAAPKTWNLLLTDAGSARHSICGVYLSYGYNSPLGRDWLCKPVLIAFLCVPFCVQAAYAQGKDETTQQTNEKIQELASLGKSTLADIPIGAGDILHIEVFDVPELSRDVRVSTMGEISFPLVHERITAAGVTPFQLEQNIQDLLRQNGLVSIRRFPSLLKSKTASP